MALRALYSLGNSEDFNVEQLRVQIVPQLQEGDEAFRCYIEDPDFEAYEIKPAFMRLWRSYQQLHLLVDGKVRNSARARLRDNRTAHGVGAKGARRVPCAEYTPLRFAQSPSEDDGVGAEAGAEAGPNVAFYCNKLPCSATPATIDEILETWCVRSRRQAACVHPRGTLHTALC